MDYYVLFFIPFTALRFAGVFPQAILTLQGFDFVVYGY